MRDVCRTDFAFHAGVGNPTLVGTTMSDTLWKLEAVGLSQRLREVTLSIEAGVTAVLGHSGAGKTSLLNLLVAFEQPDAGKLTADFNRGTHRMPLFWVPSDGGL